MSVKPDPEQSRSQIVELCEELQETRYDECSLKWDVLLRILNLPLSYMIGLRIALNGSWRKARNVKAYLATVAARESVKNGLIFKEDRYSQGSVCAGPVSHLKWPRDHNGETQTADELADWLLCKAADGDDGCGRYDEAMLADMERDPEEMAACMEEENRGHRLYQEAQTRKWRAVSARLGLEKYADIVVQARVLGITEAHLLSEAGSPNERRHIMAAFRAFYRQKKAGKIDAALAALGYTWRSARPVVTTLAGRQAVTEAVSPVPSFITPARSLLSANCNESARVAVWRDEDRPWAKKERGWLSSL